jgi:hypothetical protein
MLSTTFLCAAASACSRSALNLIDRHLYGVQRRQVRATMVMNLLLPLAACLALAVIVRPAPRLAAAFFSRGTLIPALMIQIVSYAYATAFKRLPVASVILDSKLGELLIPLALAPWAHAFQTRDVLFYGLSFLAFTPMFRRRWQTGSLRPRGPALLVILATVAQAVVFFWFPAREGASSPGDLLVFHTGVLAWRFVLSVAVLLAQPGDRGPRAPWPGLADAPVLLVRGAFFLATQITFFLTLSQPEAHLAWPILNSAALLSALAAGPVLKEKARVEEIVPVVVLGALAVVRVLLARA